MRHDSLLWDMTHSKDHVRLDWGIDLLWPSLVMRHGLLMCVWHDSWYQTWCMQVRDMTYHIRHRYCSFWLVIRHGSFMCVWHDSWYQTWCIRTCDMTQVSTCYGPDLTGSYETWLVLMRHDSFIGGTCDLTEVSTRCGPDMTHSYVWYGSFIWDMTHS